jgi:hypothetical protein
MRKFKCLKEGRTENVEFCDEKGMFVVMRKIDQWLLNVENI